ncbi:MAG TPA: hypothetical protein HA257_06195 [Candidatus Methanoperedenaceae archaeon]|nr:hypothetical protein [Candidatus Methanoperedenaceae archaeon]
MERNKEKTVCSNIGDEMTSDTDVVDFIKNKDIKLIGDRLITVPKKKEKGFFHVEMDVPEEEIDELLNDEVSQWIE